MGFTTTCSVGVVFETCSTLFQSTLISSTLIPSTGVAASAALGNKKRKLAQASLMCAHGQVFACPGWLLRADVLNRWFSLRTQRKPTSNLRRSQGTLRGRIVIR